jgi:cholesterol oxidase
VKRSTNEYVDHGRRALMASFDDDVVIIGSGFGGSVAGLRAAEKGYRVGVMESGRRWKDEDLPKSQWHLLDFLWFPDLTLAGTMRVATAGPVGSAAGLGGRARPRVGRAVIAST